MDSISEYNDEVNSESTEPIVDTEDFSDEEDNFNYNWIDICKDLNINSPLCVINFICTTLDLHELSKTPTDKEVRDTLDEIYHYSKDHITDSLDKSNAATYIKFINPSYECWDLNSLEEAVKFVIDSVVKINNFNTPTYINIGLQTPSNIKSLNACLLFLWCKKLYITPTRYMDEIDMLDCIQEIRSDSDYITNQRLVDFIKSNNIAAKLLKRNSINIYTELKNIAPSDLLTPLEVSSSEVSSSTTSSSSKKRKLEHTVDTVDTVDIDKLSTLSHEFKNINFFQREYQPKTHEESIVLAAINWNINISKKRNPLIEYDNIKSNINLYKKNMPEPDNLLCTFDNAIPENLYATDTLLNMAIKEGYTNDELRIDTPYYLLQCNSVSSNFYHGKYPYIENHETPILNEEIELLANNSVICYGVKEPGKLKATTYLELLDWFENTKNIICIFDSSLVFSETSLNKLKLMAKNVCIDDNIMEDDISTRTVIKQKLVTAIDIAKIYVDKAYQKYTKFVSLVKEKYTNEIENVKKSVTCILELGMYMRGWYPGTKYKDKYGGDMEYYVSIAPKVDNDDIIEKRVYSFMFEIFYPSLDALNNYLKNMILDIPLIKYENGVYRILNTINDGYNLGERLNIVKNGSSITNLNSCIRLSSNLFIASAYRLMCLLSMDTPFDIDFLYNAF